MKTSNDRIHLNVENIDIFSDWHFFRHSFCEVLFYIFLWIGLMNLNMIWTKQCQQHYKMIQVTEWSIVQYNRNTTTLLHGFYSIDILTKPHLYTFEEVYKYVTDVSKAFFCITSILTHDNSWLIKCTEPTLQQKKFPRYSNVTHYKL